MIIDASVAFKLIIPEEGQAAALELAANSSLIAPDLIFAELANALWRVSRRDPLLDWPAEALRLRSMIDRVVPSEDLMPSALNLAIALHHPAYDCFYLALAIAEDDVLATADRRFHAAVSASPHAARVRLLGK
jgi:predicted nucleic acid-binding protein